MAETDGTVLRSEDVVEWTSPEPDVSLTSTQARITDFCARLDIRRIQNQYKKQWFYSIENRELSGGELSFHLPIRILTDSKCTAYALNLARLIDGSCLRGSAECRYARDAYEVRSEGFRGGHRMVDLQRFQLL